MKILNVRSDSLDSYVDNKTVYEINNNHSSEMYRNSMVWRS